LPKTNKFFNVLKNNILQLFLDNDQPFRIESSGPLYHIAARGCAWQEIFLNDIACRLFFRSFQLDNQKIQLGAWSILYRVASAALTFT